MVAIYRSAGAEAQMREALPAADVDHMILGQTGPILDFLGKRS